MDVLVSNAGLSRVQPLQDITAAAFDEMLAVNLRAPFLLAQAVVPAVRDRGFGLILFIPRPPRSPAASPARMTRRPRPGCTGLTHFLASRLAASGVTVNALAPALITETGMLPGDPAQLRQRVPVGRLGQPSEVADLATAILANAYLTNQVISLDGGIHPR